MNGDDIAEATSALRKAAVEWQNARTNLVTAKTKLDEQIITCSKYLTANQMAAIIEVNRATVATALRKAK